MAEEPIRYKCPSCDADMTKQVFEQCALSSDVYLPMLVRAGKTGGKGARAAQVMLQCPNGHWAEYQCPKTEGGE